MYEVLRVPPNKDSYKHLYEYILEYIGSQDSAIAIPEFDEFYKNVVSAYMLSDGSVYQGFCWISNTRKDFPIPRVYASAGFYNLGIYTFFDEKTYNKVYDLIRTSIKDKIDKNIVVQNIPDDDNKIYDPVRNALRNNKFKKFGTSWVRIVGTPTGQTESFKKNSHILSDVYTVDKMADFHDDENSIAIAEIQNSYIKKLKDINSQSLATIIDECRLTEDDFMREADCCGYCAAIRVCPKRCAANPQCELQ